MADFGGDSFNGQRRKLRRFADARVAQRKRQLITFRVFEAAFPVCPTERSLTEFG